MDYVPNRISSTYIFDKHKRAAACMLKGSRAYNLFTDDSDYDFDVFVYPDFDELYSGIKRSETFDGGVVIHPLVGQDHVKMYEGTVYDIRRLPELIKNSNPCFLEILVSHDMCWSPLFSDVYAYIQKHSGELINNNLTKFWYSSIGVIKNEVAHLDRSNQELIDKYGYSTKKAMHAMRTLCLLEDYAKNDFEDFGSVLRYNDWNNKERRKYLLSIKQGLYKESSEFMEVYEKKLKEVEKYKDKYVEQPINTEQVDRLEELIKIDIKNTMAYEYRNYSARTMAEIIKTIEG